MNASLLSQPGLLRHPVGEQQAQAVATVDHLHAWADYFGGRRDCFSLHDRPMMTDLLRTAAVLLDDYRSGSALEQPHPRTGWMLVPVTLAPKVGAAVEAMVAVMDRPELEFSSPEEFVINDLCRTLESALDGGRAVLALLETVGANSFAQPTAHGRMNSPLQGEGL